MRKPQKTPIVMDASAMKRVLSRDSHERVLFDAMVEACGSFVVSTTSRKEYAYAVQRSGGDSAALLRRLDNLPKGKIKRIRKSAQDAKRGQVDQRALASIPRDDGHLLVDAVAGHATHIVTNDRGVLASADLVRSAQRVEIVEPSELRHAWGL